MSPEQHQIRELEKGQIIQQVKLENLQNRVDDVESKIMKKLDEMVDANKNTSDKIDKIDQYIVAQKGGWKLITIVGAVIVGIASIGKFILDLIKP